MRMVFAQSLWSSAVLVALSAAIHPTSAQADEVPGGLTKVVKKLSAGQPVKIVSLGDSVTGVYYHTGGRRAYPEMIPFALKQVYPQSAVTVINAGISGNSTVDALKRLKKDVLHHQPDLVTMMFGLNDIVRVPLPDFQKNLTSIIEQCRGVGAEVLLCTSNGVMESGGRPIAKLLTYIEAMKEVGKTLQVPVCDCYAAYERLKQADPVAWRLLLSDAIHPNMDGHKINAIEICRAISGKEVSLKDVGPPVPAAPRTSKRLLEKQPIRVLAMAPYDSLIGPAVEAVVPGAVVEVTSWPTDGQTLAKLEESSTKVRGMQPKYDLVLVAVPLSVTPPRKMPAEAGINSYIWIFNWSLSFGDQEWDVVGITPGVLKADLNAEEKQQEEFARQMIRAQDLGSISRPENSQDSAQKLLENWLRTQLTKP